MPMMVPMNKPNLIARRIYGYPLINNEWRTWRSPSGSAWIQQQNGPPDFSEGPLCTLYLA